MKKAPLHGASSGFLLTFLLSILAVKASMTESTQGDVVIGVNAVKDKNPVTFIPGQFIWILVVIRPLCRSVAAICAVVCLGSASFADDSRVGSGVSDVFATPARAEFSDPPLRPRRLEHDVRASVVLPAHIVPFAPPTRSRVAIAPLDRTGLTVTRWKLNRPESPPAFVVSAAPSSRATGALASVDGAGDGTGAQNLVVPDAPEAVRAFRCAAFDGTGIFRHSLPLAAIE